MSLEIWLAFVLASSLLLVIPGPTIMTVVSYSMSIGRRAAWPLVAAVALGDATALSLSLLGLGALLTQSAFWFQVVKWIGGLYLLWLALQMLIRAANSVETPERTPLQANAKSTRSLFVNTWLVTALNPKGMVFFVAFLPQFVSANSAVTPQLLILAATFVGLASLNTLCYALFAARAQRFWNSQQAMRGVHFLGGGLLASAGIWALNAEADL